MNWWQWLFFVIGVLTISTVLFMIVYIWVVAVNKKAESVSSKKEDPEQIMTMTIWHRTIDAMPPVGVSVQTIDIRGNQEIRYLEKVGDHVMVWKAFDEDIGVPINEITIWANKVTKGELEE